MVEHEISLAPQADPDRVERAIDAAIAEAGLRVTLRSTLRAYPGSVHWHLKQGRQAGTLEITHWRGGGRAWIAVQSGRDASWIGTMLPVLREALRRRLEGD